MKQRLSLFFLIFLAACAATPVPLTPTATLPPPQVVIETSTSIPQPSDTPAPTSTPTTQELIFPYTVEGLRQHDYQGGEIHIRETLVKTDQYTGYLIDYPSDGLTITGVMQIPVGEGPFPVIVMNHGFYARSVFSSGDGTDRSSGFLAEHGYITLASDYRSWGDSDVAESLFYSGLVIDVINLLNAIPSIPEADPDRIGMWGHSMGGGVTIKVLTIDPRVKAGVLYSPVSADHADIIARWGNGCFGDIAAGELVIGCNSADVVPLDLPLDLQNAYSFAAQNPEMMEQISPIFHLDLVTAPVQIHYGSEDGQTLSGTPPQWSVKVTQALRDSGKYAELYEYTGQGHSFIGQPWFDFMIRVLNFFNQYLK